MRATILLLLFVAAPALADAGPVPDFVRMQLKEGPSPFAGVTYHVFRVGSGAAACQTHTYAHIGTHDVRCAALSLSRFDRIMEDLMVSGLLELTDTGTPHPLAPTWRVDASSGGRTVDFLVHGPSLLDDERAARVVAGLLGEVRKVTGVEIFRDIFLPAHKLGLVTFWTHPRTEVWIDGARLGASTPILSLDLPSGTHHLRLVNPTRGIDRAGRFHVTAGKSTNFLLNVIPNARDEEPVENGETFEGTRE